MGLESGPPLWSSNIPMTRMRKLVLIAGLTLLLIIPLCQLSDHGSVRRYYKHYIYENLSKYLAHDGVYNNTLYREGSDAPVHPQWNFTSPCDSFPNTNGVLLVMKTGATEAFEKIPTHLLTSMQCLPDFLMFSDLEQQIGKYHLYNALEGVEESIKKSHGEFSLYETQLACPVSQKVCTKDMAGGWDLDKYKFLHMLVRTWEKRPDMEWYVFAEADTYIFWPNLIQWLRTKANPVKNPYVGSVAYIGNSAFAHGGSGYVISGHMVRRIVETIPNVAAKYDDIATRECCGDLLMSLAVEEAGSKVKQAHPMFNGEKPNTLPFGPGHWCEPILTMHHMDSEEVSTVWQYEQTRTNKKEILQIKEIYEAFFAPHLRRIRTDWDNLSDDTCYIGPGPDDQARAGQHEKNRQMPEAIKNPFERQAHLSARACSRVCEAAGLKIDDDMYDVMGTDEERDQFVRNNYKARAMDPEFAKDRSCFQWVYQHGTCCTASSFKLGEPRREPKDEDRWTSGWFLQGIKDWMRAMGDCDVEWTEPF